MAANASGNETEDNNTFDDEFYANYTVQDYILKSFPAQVIFCTLYVIIFVLGIFGNILVCYVVGRNRAMQTVTNFFIANLAVADVLLCSLAVPFTPGYFFLQYWPFGMFLCHIVGLTQGASVTISSLTLTSIAIDRYFVIMYPFKPRMKVCTCFCIVLSIWIFALLATLPYGIFLNYKREDDKNVCVELWPSENLRQLFSIAIAIMQFVLPFTVISFCYVRVSVKLSDRARSKPGSKNSKKEAVDRERKRRTNRMLIAMVTIFGISWLPLSLVNLLNDVYMHVDEWEYYNLCFFTAHAIAMSSTCYNPFVYAWLNENFRKEFKQVLPCFSFVPMNKRSLRFVSEKTCNGNETVQESVMPTTSKAIAVNTNLVGRTSLKSLETIEEQVSNSQTENNLEHVSAKYCSVTNQVEIHVPQLERVSSSDEISQTTTSQFQLNT